MPRKSSDAIAIAQIDVRQVERPDAPYDLTDEQVDVWRRVVNSQPADWFGPETYDILSQYCRHVVDGRKCAQLIANLTNDPDGLDVEQYDKLLKMQEREGRAASSLATRLRITPQSTYDPKKAKPKEKKKLWESEGSVTR